MWISGNTSWTSRSRAWTQGAEGNVQVQDIIFHLYCTCCFTFIFCSQGQPAGRAASVKAQPAVQGTLLPVPAVPTATWHRVCPQQCSCNWTQPACSLSRWEDWQMFNTSPQFSSGKKKKRHIILGKAGKLCDSYYSDSMLNNFNFENFKSIRYFIAMFFHNTLRMTNSIWWGGINAHFI